jgi:hypothetical protein
VRAELADDEGDALADEDVETLGVPPVDALPLRVEESDADALRDAAGDADARIDALSQWLPLALPEALPGSEAEPLDEAQAVAPVVPLPSAPMGPRADGVAPAAGALLSDAGFEVLALRDADGEGRELRLSRALSLWEGERLALPEGLRVRKGEPDAEAQALSPPLAVGRGDGFCVRAGCAGPPGLPAIHRDPQLRVRSSDGPDVVS